MRVLVTGSRHWRLKKPIFERLRKLPEGSTVCQGGAKGADTVARDAAKELGLRHITYRADWAKYGKRAGPIRNKLMLDDFKPELVLAYPIADSKGTWDMVNRANRLGIPVEVYQR